MREKPGSRTVFIAASLVCLAAGLVSISRAGFRPVGQFTVAREGERIQVGEVVLGGVADRAGLLEGDRLLTVGGQAIAEPQDVEFLLLSRRAGQKLSLAVERDGAIGQIALVLVPKFDTQFVALNLFLGLLFWCIAVFVYLKKADDRAARIFGWGSIALALVVMMVWPGYPYGLGVAGYVLPTAYFLVYPFVPAFVLYFTLVYPREKRFLERHRALLILLFGPAMAFVALLELSYLGSIYLDSAKHYRTFVRVYDAFRLYLTIYLVACLAFLVDSYRRSRSRESRNKIQWILAGMCVGATPFLFLWSLPQALGLRPLVPEVLNYVFLMLIPLSFAFSIVRYHALDVDLIIKRGIVYLILTGLIIGMYLVTVGFAGYVLQTTAHQPSSFLVIVFTLIAAVLFAPLRRRVQVLVDKTFYRVKYNYRVAISEFGSAVSAAHDRRAVIDLLLEKMGAAIPVEKAALLLRDRASGVFRAAGSLGFDAGQAAVLTFADTDDVVLAAKRAKVPLLRRGRADITHSGELPRDPITDAAAVELLVPVTVEEELEGLLILGRKLSSARYSEEDLELLRLMAEEAIIAAERLRLQEEMILERAEKEKLEEISRLKSEFVSHVSHELRTPLTSITWSVENLLDGIPEAPSPKVQEYLTGIHGSATHLSRMIENLLDITKIEAGEMDIFPEKIDLAGEIQTCLDALKPLAEKKDVALKMVAPEGLWIRADRDALRAVLTNLVDNAVKYSPKGETVQVEASMADGTEVGIMGRKNVAMAAVRVVDRGPGIPPDKQEAIFERFGRVKTDKATRAKGLGLGLHIVRKLVEAQGGRIWVESEVGTGSVFAFVVPGGRTA